MVCFLEMVREAWSEVRFQLPIRIVARRCADQEEDS